MAEDDYSCLETVEETVHVALPMSYAGNPSVGVKEYLDSWKCQHIPVLDGLVVDFKKVTFESPLGRIINDQACLHYDVRAEFSLFKPSTGKLLKGVVNRISTQHVGCVVHDSINASIYISADQAASNALDFVGLDTVVLFELTNVEIHKKVIRLKGKFTDESIELSRKLFPNQNLNHIFYDDVDVDYDGQPLNNSTVQSERCGSQKRKRKHVQATGDELVNNDSNGGLSYEVDSLSPSKKKRKKRKRTDLEISGLETIEDNWESLDAEKSTLGRDSSYSEIDNQGSSFVDGGGSSKHKKKKKSRSKELNESYVETSSDYVKSRKKHKKSSVG